MQKRVLISTIPVATSVAKPTSLYKLIVTVNRQDTIGGIFASLNVYRVVDDSDPLNPVIDYNVVTPNNMSQTVTYADLTLLESAVVIPPVITSLNEQLTYFDLCGAINIMVNDAGGPMFGLDVNQWEIININNHI